MDRLEAMEMLVEAVDGGSLTFVAKKRKLPLPTISRKITELENRLGAKLLQRSSRKLTLTGAGADYLAVCRRVLEDVGEAERAVAGEFRSPQGELVLTAPVVIGRRHVVPVITEFLARYPDIRLQLLLSDRNVHLIDDHVDLALRFGALPSSSLVAIRLGQMRSVVCASPRYVENRGTPGRPEDLGGHDIISHDLVNPAGSWTFAEADGLIDVPVQPRLSVTTADAAVKAAAGGAGVTRVLLYQAHPAIERGELVVLLRDFERAPLPFHLVHAGLSPQPLKVRTFLDFAVPRLRAVLSRFDAL
jgi:DNA-binding transcriptional LysR family regulator